MNGNNFIKDNWLFFVELLAMGLVAITMVFHVQYKKLEMYENYMKQNDASVVKCQSCDKELNKEFDKYCANCGMKIVEE